jgi:hypothetical protein
MSKQVKSALPKIISKANREISTIIENDIAKESALLKELVDQVLAANLDVKKKNNQRITETRRRMQELDIEIDELNKSIDLVDRETVIEQLNEMIDAENKIFKSRQEIRFFENERVGEKLAQLDNIYNNLAESIFETKNKEEQYQALLHATNDKLFEKQFSVTKHIISLMKQLYQEKQTYVIEQLNKAYEIKEHIEQLENTMQEELFDTMQSIRDVQNSSLTEFKDIDDDSMMSEKITNNYQKTKEELAQKKQQLEDSYAGKQQNIIDTYHHYEEGIRQKLMAQNQAAIDQEKQQQAKKDEELHNIRLLIIDAEKKQDFATVKNLMKKFEKVEKSSVATVTDRTDRLLKQQTKKTKDKTIKQLLSLALKQVTDINKVELAIKLEDIKFEEAKILYKIKHDHEALQGDIGINKQILATIDTYMKSKLKQTTDLYQLKQDLRIAELEIMKQNEFRDIDLSQQFVQLLQEVKEMEQERIITLLRHATNHEMMKIEQQYHIGKTVADLKLAKQLSDIDKLILRTRNESLIKVEKMKEDANSEIIYQESLIKIAQKERELQLKKVHSLYENERTLAEEQVERINLGIKVNDTFMKTTLQNQLLFAEQQIQCAQSEFDIRVENINLTLDQELTYANKKIEYYRQKYEYEKSKIRKELNDKLEDLQFKLLLFTDKKENDSIQEQINVLEEKYQAMIDEIDSHEHQDPEIARYEEVMRASERRAQQAIAEASALKEQTTTAFEALYQQTKEKFQLMEETNHAQDTQGIMPLLNSGAVNSANDRLQIAIKDAEELFEERIQVPSEIIRTAKEELLKMTQDEETERFIESQKVLKKERIKEHANAIEQLYETRQQALEHASNTIEEHRKARTTEIETLVSEVLANPVYRDETAIVQDYEQLIQKEKDYYKEALESQTAFVTSVVEEHNKVLKETTLQIKQAIKPYKKYIRKASRGLNAEKKEMIRKNKRILRKQLSDAEDQFEIEL